MLAFSGTTTATLLRSISSHEFLLLDFAPTEFFRRWFAQVKDMEEYSLVIKSPSEKFKVNCDILKERCRRELRLSADESNVFQAAVRGLDYELYAVRSSSPEEDLSGASFAGSYETKLGVNKEGIEEAVLCSFCSCFDERVFCYKKERGFDIKSPTIAVIVQEQIRAESAGVAFSLNPLNNCYDEAVVTANFGLGESVVSGTATPDSFVVDKVSRKIETKVGSKEVSIEVGVNGGTRMTPVENPEVTCLNETQVLEIVDMLEMVARFSGKPVDIEWAYERRHGIFCLHLLQARPITAYVPLPDLMITQPGTRKMLYMDVTLLKQGVQEPFSVFGMEYFDNVQRHFTAKIFGKQVVCAPGSPPDTCLYFNLEGRSYTNISNMMRWFGVTKLAKSFRTTDTLAVAILENIAEREYAAEQLPPNLKYLTFSIIVRNIGMLWSTMKAYWSPNEYLLRYEKESSTFLRSLEELKKTKPPIRVLVKKSVDIFVDLICHHTLPMTAAAEWGRSKMYGMFENEPEEVQSQLAYLERSLDHNITIKMGLDMFKLSQRSEVRNCTSGDEFERCVQARSFSAEFFSSWDKFLEEFGCRCPFELDAASARPSESPKLLYEKLKIMSKNVTDDTNPELIFLRAQKQREDAHDWLCNHLKRTRPRLLRKFTHYYKVFATLGGFREIHKYYWILAIYHIRARILEYGTTLASAGRIANVNDVFSLRLHQLEEALENPSLDLIPSIESNLKFRTEKAIHIREYPLCIDSRGKIIRPPRRFAHPGEFAGAPISPGLVRGRAKVLHCADEKPVHPGEILVARATDPGWTPLFVNASGIVLEVGGLLQHGALVAREYGKPCVAGIYNVVELLHDGQMVEVDGASGIVRIVDETSLRVEEL